MDVTTALPRTPERTVAATAAMECDEVGFFRGATVAIPFGLTLWAGIAWAVSRLFG